MTFAIRRERKGDLAAIAAVVEQAFVGHPHSQGTEAHIIAALRRSGALTLSLVAEHEGGIVGHIAFSPVSISSGTADWYALGPLAVAPSSQRKGVGDGLVRAGLDALKGIGSARGCVVVGDPSYYRRFGFESTAECSVPGIPQEYVLVLPFDGAAAAGRVTHHPAFHAEA